jgi:2-oxoglutarate dehydrogenase E2 component (dihydrolipoamide succinyltransferase)
MLVRQYSVDPSHIAPTGKEGRVTVDDVMRAVETRSVTAGYTAGPIPSPPMPTITKAEPVSETAVPAAPAKKVPLYRVDIPVFEPLPESIRETFEDIDLTELTAYRKEIKASFIENYGANITFMPFICKAVCAALKEYPKLNASMTEKEIIYKNYYNIGIAVARDEGLIVPVIRDVDKKSIVELAVEIAQIGEKARTNRLTPDDVSGGTFSLTNAGMFGATASTPVINQPQVAILGIHAIVKKPWVVNGEIVIRDISSFGLSFDHRLIDGHTAVQFLHRVHEFLTDIKKLLLFLR